MRAVSRFRRTEQAASRNGAQRELREASRAHTRIDFGQLTSCECN